MRCPRFVRLWLLGLCALSSRAVAAPWSELTSDLPADPGVRWGVLPNGLRYAIMPNHEPKGRVSLRLLVSAGSLHETDDERGLAHFIEHMAFRGTQAYPRGALVPALEHAGIALGPDNTAFTTGSYTIYHLELPDSREAMLRLGFGVFSEYAGAITFDPDLIDRERGVILSEKATRDTPELRVSETNQAFLWPSARAVRRPPIGTEEAVRHFTREQFVSFYNAWYRPERLAVIVVGDVVVDDCVRLITEIFSPLQARAPAREEPANLFTTEASQPNIVVLSDPRWAGMTFTLEHPLAETTSSYSHAWRVNGLHRALAFAMLQKRLEQDTHQVLGNYVAPAVTVSSVEPKWLLSSISVSGNVQNWRPLAAEIEQQHRRAFQHGFTQEELRQAKVQVAAAYENAVRIAATRTSPELAADLCGVLLYGGIFSTPVELQRDLAADLESTSPGDCLKAFREAWGNDPPHVFLAVNSQASIVRTDVLQVLNQSRNTPVQPPEEKAPVLFAYPASDAPGHLRREEHVADLDVQLGEYDNGVRLNFKPTAFEADSVMIALRVGNGRLSQPPGQVGLNLFANAALMNGGLRRHSIDDLNAIMAGHNLGVSFTVGDEACVFSARCTRRELLLCLRLITAYLTDASFDPGMIRQVRASLSSIYVSVANSPGGPIQATAEYIMTGDRRFGLPAADDLLSRDYLELARWLEPQFKQGSIELGVVGDVPWEEVKEAVGRTLGALPARPPRTASAVAAVRFTKIHNATIFTTSSTLTQSTVAFFWPVPDVTDVSQERRCVVAAAVLAERVRERLREDLGTTYTPAAEFVRNETFPGFNYFFVTADVSPAHALQVGRIVAQEITALRTKGVNTDTFERVRQPYLRAREDDMRTNVYWLYNVLSDAQQNPWRLAAARSRSADGAAITRDEINALLRRYLAPETAFLFSTYPAAQTGAGAVAGSALKADAPAQPDKLPRPISQDKPLYPAALRAKGITGTVTVEFVIDPTGHVKNPRAISSPDPQLSRAAEEAVSKWLFTPAEKNGKKVSSFFRVPIVFDLGKK